MQGPHARLRLAGCDVVLLGTVAGFAPDADRVVSAFAEARPDLVALGVPAEDLATLDAVAAAGGSHPDLGEPDDITLHFLRLLGRFGATRIPSPDLEAAHRLARQAGVPLATLDLDDAAHADAYTQRVKFRHVVRTNRLRRKVLQQEFLEAADAYDLAARWDAYLGKPAPLREVEALREEWMAARLRDAAAGRTLVLAVVPAVRMGGLAARLRP